MDLKAIQKQLKELRDRIKREGYVSPESEHQLKDIMNNTLVSAKDEIASMQDRLNTTMVMRAGNDNALSDDQKKRLRLIEKTGTGSHAVH